MTQPEKTPHADLVRSKQHNVALAVGRLDNDSTKTNVALEDAATIIEYLRRSDTKTFSPEVTSRITSAIREIVQAGGDFLMTIELPREGEKAGALDQTDWDRDADRREYIHRTTKAGVKDVLQATNVYGDEY